MKQSELLQNQETLRADLEVIRTAIVAEDRVMTAEETASVETIARSLEEIERNLNTIKLAEAEAAKRSVIIIPNKKDKVMTNLQIVRELALLGNNTDNILKRNQELAAGVATGGVFISRASMSMADDGANVAGKVVKDLNVLEGIPNIWDMMGATVYNDLKGSVATLPFMDPYVGSSAVEGSNLTKETTSTNSVTLTPTRSGVQIQVTREALAGFSEMAWNGILKNAYNTIDRQISAKIYSAIISGSTLVSTATAVDKAGFDALEAAVPVDGAFFMPRSVFFTAKGVSIDTGSFRFLADRVGQDYGVTYDGYPIFHSGLFKSAANTLYYTYGVQSNICIGFWGNDAYEVIVDSVSGALAGNLLITISKVNDIKIPNVAKAFVKSADIDPAV